MHVAALPVSSPPPFTVATTPPRWLISRAGRRAGLSAAPAAQRHVKLGVRAARISI